MLVIFDCKYCVSYQLLKCVNCSVLWDGRINITKGTIYSFINLLSSQHVQYTGEIMVLLFHVRPIQTPLESQVRLNFQVTSGINYINNTTPGPFSKGGHIL